MKGLGFAVCLAVIPTLGFAQEQDTNVMDQPMGEGTAIEGPHGMYEEIGTAGDWTAIRFTVEGKLTCAIFSRPLESRVLENGEPIAALRGERAIFITWETGPVAEEGGVFSALMGAPVDEKSLAHKFESERGVFDLFAGFGDRLFVFPEKDPEAIAAIRAGAILTLTATLPGGRVAEDKYSLKGVMNSTKMAQEVCGTP